jgi:hypothetical protein
VKKILFIILTGFVICFLSFAQNQEPKPKVAIIKLSNEYIDEKYEPLCDAITETIEFTLRVMNRYEIKRTDYINPYDDFKNAKAFFEDYNYDNAIFGKVFPDKAGNIVLQVSVFDRQKDDISIQKEKKVQSLLDTFEASDELIIELLEAFSDTHIGFGKIVLLDKGPATETRIYVDGEIAGENIIHLSLPHGRRVIEVREPTESGERIIEKIEVLVEENKSKEILYNSETEKEPEQPESRDKGDGEEKEVLPRSLPTRLYFDDENNIVYGKQLFFPNVLHDYKEFFLMLEEMPDKTNTFLAEIEDYQRANRTATAAFFGGLGLTGVSIISTYITGALLAANIAANALPTGLVIGVAASGAGILGGLITAGIGAIAVFTAKPITVVAEYNNAYGK